MHCLHIAFPTKPVGLRGGTPRQFGDLHLCPICRRARRRFRTRKAPQRRQSPMSGCRHQSQSQGRSLGLLYSWRVLYSPLLSYVKWRAALRAAVLKFQTPEFRSDLFSGVWNVWNAVRSGLRVRFDFVCTVISAAVVSMLLCFALRSKVCKAGGARGGG